MENKTAYLGIIIIILMSLTVSNVSAIKTTDEEVPFSFSSWFKHTFNIGTFTIVGQNQNCDVYCKPHPSATRGTTLYFNNGDLMNVDASDYCQYGLIDVYLGGPTNFWSYPWREFRDEFSAWCGSSRGCTVEVYCCNHPECSSDSQCESWKGEGSRCVTKYEVDPYMPLSDSQHNTIDHFNYCTDACTGPPITCWRISGDTCESRTYTCGYETYPNCPLTYPYTSQAECEADIVEPEPKTCAELGTDMNACYNRADCMWTRFGDCRTIEDAECTGMREQDCLQGSECEWTGTMCQFKSGGNGDGKAGIGEPCTTDSDCESGHCDKQGWWIFGSYKCSPVPWGEIPRLPVTKDKVATMTTKDKLGHLCLTSTQCIEVENYEVSCVSIKSLKDEGVITDPVNFLEGTKTTIDGIIGSATGFAIGGAAICGTTAVLAGLACIGSGVGCFTLPAAVGACTTVTGGAALIGAGVGYSSAQKQIAVSREDPLVKAVEAEDESMVGLCIAEKKTEGGVINLDNLFKWAAFFDITGDGQKDWIDGLLIVIIGIIGLSILTKFL